MICSVCHKEFATKQNIKVCDVCIADHMYYIPPPEEYERLKAEARAIHLKNMKKSSGKKNTEHRGSPRILAQSYSRIMVNHKRIWK